MEPSNIYHTLQQAGISVIPSDIAYIQYVHQAILKSSPPVNTNLTLHQTVPITIVDKQVILDD